MDRETLKMYAELDDLTPDGTFTAEPGTCPDYDMKRLRQYCKEKGIKADELTEEEVNMFIIKED